MRIDFIGPTTAHFGQMGWPRPCDALDEVNHRLRYGQATPSDLLVAAGVISAYIALIDATEEKRRLVVRTLRASRNCKLGPQRDQAAEKLAKLEGS